jgi:glycyl-tRNA synthetase beta chain
MSNYLLEIGTEELPANFLQEAEANLKEAIATSLAAEELDYKELITYSTPRRVAVLVKGVPESQRTVEKKQKGPPTDRSFDAHGAPLPAALGFAQRNGVTVDQLVREKMGEIEYLVANLTITGKPASEVLAQIAPKAIKSLGGERMMRWGSGDLKFSRPIRWIVSLLDDQVVPFQLEALTADRISHGHRVLSKGPVKIAHADQYKAALLEAGVTVDRAERRSLIEKLVQEAALTVSGQPRKMNESLLEEVVNLTESPCAVVGGFAKEYLELPEKLIETIMVHHQRYFPIESRQQGQNKLLPHFVTIANNTIASAHEKIRQGNERVLKARLADGRFFYFDDQKTPLAQRGEALAQLTFQEGLGSYRDKIERLNRAATVCAKQLQLSDTETKQLGRAIELCKADLVANLVRELPELQGFVGSWYAEREKEAPPIVAAIASHYSPRSTDDELPPDRLGKIVAVLDKFDTLAGGFLMGRKPSGSSDPYALRRQAQGLVDICTESTSDLQFNLSILTDQFLKVLSEKVTKPKLSLEAARLEIVEFLLQRLKGKLLEEGYMREIVEAVTASRDSLANLADTRERCRALSKFTNSELGSVVLRAGVRVANIVADEKGSAPGLENVQLSEAPEVALLSGFKTAVVEKWTTMPEVLSGGQYIAYLESFHPIAPLIDDFFDKLMVNDPDPVKRTNRRSLLANINDRLRYVADFSKLKTLESITNSAQAADTLSKR